MKNPFLKNGNYHRRKQINNNVYEHCKTCNQTTMQVHDQKCLVCQKCNNYRLAVPKYNHAFSIAFSVDSNNTAENVTESELLKGLEERLADMKQTGEIIEACGMPWDTYENDTQKETL